VVWGRFDEPRSDWCTGVPDTAWGDGGREEQVTGFTPPKQRWWVSARVLHALSQHTKVWRTNLYDTSELRATKFVVFRVLVGTRLVCSAFSDVRCVLAVTRAISGRGAAATDTSATGKPS
jgi:hypothetical protein